MHAPEATHPTGRLFVITAPSGAGKTTLVRALMQQVPSLQFSISYTTRKPRPAEIDGRDYHFTTPEVFQDMVARGEFLEHAQVFDNYYGSSLPKVREAVDRGERLLLEIDWQGARQVRERLPEALSIFILPPSRSALEERLRRRSTDPEAIIQRRLKDASQDLSHWSEFDYVVINDRLEQAIAELKAIVAGQGAALVAGRPEIARFAATLVA